MSRLIILAGPDGAGKSTLAKALWKMQGGRLLHFNRQKTLTRASLARMYTEAMTPAILNYDHIIMDRSWVCERPYADEYWDGDDRLGIQGRRILERIAMRAEACVVFCDPGWETVKTNFQTRKFEDAQSELLDDTDQLARIYAAYGLRNTGMPWVTYDYTKESPGELMARIEQVSTAYHPTEFTAGSMDAPFLIVTPDHPAPADSDSFYRFPMCEHSGAGESRWVALQLAHQGINECYLKWVTSEHLMQANPISRVYKKVVALGGLAAARCREVQMDHVELPHPTAFKKANPRSFDYFKGVFAL